MRFHTIFTIWDFQLLLLWPFDSYFNTLDLSDVTLILAHNFTLIYVYTKEWNHSNLPGKRLQLHQGSVVVQICLRGGQLSHTLIHTFNTQNTHSIHLISNPRPRTTLTLYWGGILHISRVAQMNKMVTIYHYCSATTCFGF